MGCLAMAVARTVVLRTFEASLEDIAAAFETGLKSCFQNVSVSVADCPDLTNKPFALPSSGLLGNNTVCDVGSFSYLIPVADTSRRYTFSEVISASKLQTGQLIGAGAGPFFTAGKNCEAMMGNRDPNELFNTSTNYIDWSYYYLKGSRQLASHELKSTRDFQMFTLMAAIVKVAENDVRSNNTLHGVYNKSEDKPGVLKATDNNFALLGHFLATEGNPGKVLAVDVSVRAKDGSIYTFLREALTAKFGNESAPVALGGAFVLDNSKGRFHVMPDFPKKPVDSPAKISSWLKFYEMSPPVMGVGTIVSHDPVGYFLSTLEFVDCLLDRFNNSSSYGEPEFQTVLIVTPFFMRGNN
ncbi:unnamed protein product [Schistocephalus solidus]|uniref:DUF1907 domain-containing protein n=1 Tax=Schistocephalus solidus TaxID=70667 RepID=A0A183SZ16_SCHSO|nr:unnamed protein product [Schistocephalus solidus]